MIIDKSHRLQQVTEYYFSTKLKEINQRIADGKPIINLGIGSPDLAPPKKVMQTISETVLDQKKHSYQSYQGLLEFREAIATFYHTYYKVTLNPQNDILPLMGSKEGIMHISMAFLNDGDEVLIPNPGYMTYTSVTKLVNAKPILYDLKAAHNWFPDIRKLEQSDLSKVKLMWLNYPNMPTGASGTLHLFEQLVAFAQRHRILLINDNPYSFILNKKPLSIFSVKGAKEVALELNSLSKTFNMAGWRVGMLLGKSDYIKTVLQVKSNMDSGMFYGIQKGAIAALQTDSEWFAKTESIYKERRKLVWKILDKLQCTYDKQTVGLFVWGKIPNNTTSMALTDYLLDNKNIFITPGTIFGTNGEGYIRVSLCVDKKILINVLDRL